MNDSKLISLWKERPAPLADLALRLRAWGLDLYPGSYQLAYDNYASSLAFSHSEKLGDGFAHIAIYKAHLNLGFDQGAFLDDPGGLLKGTGKQIRHIRVDSWETFPTTSVVELLSQAVGSPPPENGELVWKS